MNASEIEAAVDKLLVDAMVDYNVSKIGTRETDNWKHDLWHISFYRRGKGKSCYFEFRTGIGNRSKRTGVAIKPKAANVLYCLIREATARDQSFPDWCADCGYDSDSFKALNTYNECCETATKLRRVFKLEEITELAELTRDY